MMKHCRPGKYIMMISEHFVYSPGRIHLLICNNDNKTKEDAYELSSSFTRLRCVSSQVAVGQMTS